VTWQLCEPTQMAAELTPVMQKVSAAKTGPSCQRRVPINLAPY